MKAKRKMARANMQNAERNERPKRQNERDGWRQIGKKWKARSARRTTGKQIAFCYGFFAAWEQLIFL